MLDDLAGYTQRDTIPFAPESPVENFSDQDTDPGIPSHNLGTTLDFPEPPRK